MSFLAPFVLWLKALHVIAMVAWMSGLFYLPRLYVYHCQVAPGSAEGERFKVMERRLLKQITTPAMIVTWIAGLLMAGIPGVVDMHALWFPVKFVLVLLMTGFHGACSRWRRDFLNDRNRRPEKFYRIANEVPTLLLIAIVVLVIVKPF
jgi:protoporphyrinogen IX oxidase